MGELRLNVSIGSVKLGTSDVKLYIGDILLYPKVITVITTTSSKPTEGNIAGIFTQKPSEELPLVTTTVTKPTLLYLAYPLDWEVMENGQIIKPVIKDSNGFEVGFEIDEDTPTIVSDGVTYRVLDILLGVDNYTIEF